MLSFLQALSQPATQYPFYQLPSNHKGKDWAITDIHGCSQTFLRLLNRINLQTNDRLFLLGDYINKGPDSAGVLNIILSLLYEGKNIWPLRGNHEQMLIDDWEATNPTYFFATRAHGNPRQFVDRARYEQFIYALPYYYELENVILVHAGLKLNAFSPLEEYEEMLWIRGMYEQKGYTKQIIHGHEPMFWEFIQQDVENNAPIINLDNGCVNKYQYGQGHLLALDLSKMRLYREPCIDL